MKLSRLHFLKSLSLLPIAGFSVSASGSAAKRSEESEDVMYSEYDPRIEVYPENLRHNAREIAAAVDGKPIMAVIKNNGYGMGVVRSAEILEPMDEIEGFGVVKLSEALQLRKAGITKPVTLLALCHGDELEEAVRQDITPMVYTPLGEELEQLAQKYDKQIPVEVKLDVGLGRIGLRGEEIFEICRDLHQREGVAIKGTFITFTEARDFDKEKIERFSEAVSALSSEGIDTGRMHAASTTPIFRHPEAHFDMVRPGIGLYGVYPQPEDQREKQLMDLRPAFSLKCKVIHVKQLQKGDTAGYGQAFEAQENTWLATLPMGHADGWQRSAAECAKVRINDKLYPVVASVSASHTLVDLGAETDVQVGDEAIIFDDQEGSRPDDIVKACGTSAYDLLMHLNPQIPREVV